ncbi:MAG: Aromatic-L-amino-acid decarboxylase, partial [Rhodospirillales bacterium]|nr:Aromatic-L-amino-acid decarboxylase [Rhodospirillales bacterium]
LAADYLQARRDAPVVQELCDGALRSALARYDFAAPRPAEQVAADLFDLLARSAVHSDHPRYFGLFNPPALPEAIAGDLIAATINPQLAVVGHAPAAAAIERRLIELFGVAIGWPPAEVAGSFTSGGSEANHTALLAALARRYPGWATHGIASIGNARPAIYVSAEAHLAWVKLARAAGLGSDAVQLVETDDGLRLTANTLQRAIDADPSRDPLLLVATAGTTAHGAVDDIAGLADLRRRTDSHLHVDAAWAGGGVLVPELRALLPGLELADSITIDPHKFLSVPMGTGLYLARDWRPLETAFAVQTGYMPSATLRDPYVHSLQWSRRFLGLRLFVALAALGLDGVRALLRRQVAMGALLRQGLVRDGWRIVNDTPLPLVCFEPAEGGDVAGIESFVVQSGGAWISSVRLRGRKVLRACITSYETEPRDVEALLDLLHRARR